MKYLGYLCLLILLAGGVYLVSLEPPPVERETIIAKIIEIKGSVERRSFMQATWEEIKVNDPIYDVDEIRTGDASEAHIEFTKDGNKISISEKTTALLKSSSVKVNEGTIENQSSQDNPFNISIGEVEVLFQKQKGFSLNLKDGNSFHTILNNKIEELRKKSTHKDLKSIQETLNKIDPQSKKISTFQKLWEQLLEIEKEVKKDQKVKLSFDEKTNSLKAQVAEGEITLKKSDGAVIDVKKGQGVLFSNDTGEAQTIELLSAPNGNWPNDQQIIYNVNTPTLSWKPISGANTYHIEVSDTRDFANVLFKTQTSGNSTKVNPLKYNDTYYWKIWAIDNYGFDGAEALLSFDLQEDRTPPDLKVDDIKFD